MLSAIAHVASTCGASPSWPASSTRPLIVAARIVAEGRRIEARKRQASLGSRSARPGAPCPSRSPRRLRPAACSAPIWMRVAATQRFDRQRDAWLRERGAQRLLARRRHELQRAVEQGLRRLERRARRLSPFASSVAVARPGAASPPPRSVPPPASSIAARSKLALFAPSVAKSARSERTGRRPASSVPAAALASESVPRSPSRPPSARSRGFERGARQRSLEAREIHPARLQLERLDALRREWRETRAQLGARRCELQREARLQVLERAVELERCASPEIAGRRARSCAAPLTRCRAPSSKRSMRTSRSAQRSGVAGDVDAADRRGRELQRERQGRDLRRLAGPPVESASEGRSIDSGSTETLADRSAEQPQPRRRSAPRRASCLRLRTPRGRRTGRSPACRAGARCAAARRSPPRPAPPPSAIPASLPTSQSRPPANARQEQRQHAGNRDHDEAAFRSSTPRRSAAGSRSCARHRRGRRAPGRSACGSARRTP